MANDYVAALLVTVLDFRMTTVAVRRAERHFKGATARIGAAISQWVEPNCQGD